MRVEGYPVIKSENESLRSENLKLWDVNFILSNRLENQFSNVSTWKTIRAEDLKEHQRRETRAAVAFSIGGAGLGSGLVLLIDGLARNQTGEAVLGGILMAAGIGGAVVIHLDLFRSKPYLPRIP